jgi:transposase
MDEIFGVLCGFGEGGRELTVVFDKRMNSEDTLARIDSQSQLHFITTYSTCFAEEFAGLDPKHFHPLEIPKNRALREEG